MDKEKLQTLLSNIYQDIIMLKEGTWVPDKSSCEATLEAIEKVAIELNIKIKKKNNELLQSNISTFRKS